MKEISIIIPVSNCASTLSGILSDLKRQSFRNFEVLFVDHHSCDQTPQQIRAFQRLSGIPCQIIESRHRTSVWESFNLALPDAHGQHVMFLLPDCRLSSTYLETLIAQDTPVTGVHTETLTYHHRHELLAGLLSQQTPETVIGLLIDRQLIGQRRFDPALGDLAPRLFLYDLFNLTARAAFVATNNAFIVTRQSSETTIPPYRETLQYLGQLHHAVQTFHPELTDLIWFHHHYALSALYQQIRQLSFNTRQLYSEELRDLQRVIKDIERQKLSFSNHHRLRSWLNRRYNRHIISYVAPVTSVTDL